MAIWSSEIKELEKLDESLKGQLPDLEKELERLIKADDENMILLYSRRCLEVIITDLCECELKRPRKTEPLKGILDKLHKEEKVPSNIITSMHGLNDLSTYGAHPKDFDPEQIKPVLVNLDITIKWYLKYKDLQIADKSKSDEVKYDSKQSNVSMLEKSIIVLPFENISPDPDQEYFSDGLTEEIITDLSHIHDLKVISRSSAMTFKGTKKTVPEIAGAVNVRYVLEGSVRKAGNNLLITAQLIDGKNDSHIWAEKYKGSLEDVFDIQEKVSHSIAEALKIKMIPEEAKRLFIQPTRSLKAFELCLRSHHYRDMFTMIGLKKAIEYLEQALVEDPTYSLAYAEIATCYWGLGNLGHESPNDTYPQVKKYALKALELDESLAEAHMVLGFYSQDYEWDWTNTEKEHLLAIRLKPNDSFIHMAYSWYLALVSRHEESISEMTKALELDPLSVVPAACIGEVLMLARKSDLAIEQCKNVIVKEPGYWTPYSFMGIAYLQKGQNLEAVEVLNKGAMLSGRDTVAVAFLGNALGTVGRIDEARDILTELKARREKSYLSPFWLSMVHLGLGEQDQALDWLLKGYQERAGYMFLIHKYCQFDPLHSNIVFQELCRKMNLKL